MRCICGAELKDIVSEVAFRDVVILDVPHQICPECGEEVFDARLRLIEVANYAKSKYYKRVSYEKLMAKITK